MPRRKSRHRRPDPAPWDPDAFAAGKNLPLHIAKSARLAEWGSFSFPTSPLTTQAKLSLTQQALDVFDAGPRVTTVHECNALRKLTYGKLAELAHAQPGLPNNFSDRFFIMQGGSREPSIAQLTKSIERLRAKLKRQESLLESIVDQDHWLLLVKAVGTFRPKEKEPDRMRAKLNLLRAGVQFVEAGSGVTYSLSVGTSSGL